MQLKELIKTINFEGRQVMYIDNMIVKLLIYKSYAMYVNRSEHGIR